MKEEIMLNEIQKQTERIIQELQWSDEQTNAFINRVNHAINRNMGTTVLNDDLDSSLVKHSATYSGGFILFGGWTKIFDQTIPSGTRGHELYLAFGGIGAGGWKGDCDIEIDTEGSFNHNGKRYSMPINHYGDNNWDGYNTGFQWFHDKVKSFMFMYLPVFCQPIPIFAYFDSDSHQIGISVPNCSLSCGIGGGSVKVKS